MALRPDIASIRRALEGREPRHLEAHDPGQEERAHRAAVAAVLRRDDEPEVLFIRRAEHPEDPWSGHMAFPGGRLDPGDPDVLYTARRETREELGLDLARDAELLGRLDDVPAIARGRPTGLVISPFVFVLRGTPALVPNHEVAEALWAPLGPLMRGELDTTLDYRHEQRVIPFPAYDVEGRVVWGLTYQMLQILFGVLRDASR